MVRATASSLFRLQPPAHVGTPGNADRRCHYAADSGGGDEFFAGEALTALRATLDRTRAYAGSQGLTDAELERLLADES